MGESPYLWPCRSVDRQGGSHKSPWPGFQIWGSKLEDQRHLLPVGLSPTLSPIQVKLALANWSVHHVEVFWGRHLLQGAEAVAPRAPPGQKSKWYEKEEDLLSEGLEGVDIKNHLCLLACLCHQGCQTSAPVLTVKGFLAQSLAHLVEAWSANQARLLSLL